MVVVVHLRIVDHMAFSLVDLRSIFLIDSVLLPILILIISPLFISILSLLIRFTPVTGWNYFNLNLANFNQELCLFSKFFSLSLLAHILFSSLLAQIFIFHPPNTTCSIATDPPDALPRLRSNTQAHSLNSFSINRCSLVI